MNKTIMDKFLTRTFLVLVLFSILSSFCYAINPHVQDSNGLSNEFSIINPKFDSFKFGSNFTLHFHVYNSSGILLKNNSIDCLFYFYNSSGRYLIENNKMSFDSNNVDFFQIITPQIASYKGVYTYLVSCNNSISGGFLSSNLEVSSFGGVTDPFEGIFIILGILAIVIILLYFSFNINEEHIVLKFFTSSFSLLLLLLIPSVVNAYIYNPFTVNILVYYTWFLRIFGFYLFGYYVLYKMIVQNYLGIGVKK